MNSASSLRARLLAGVFSAAVLAAPMIARAADQDFNIAPQSLDTALADFSRQSMLPVLATPAVTGAKQTSGYVGASDPQTALAMLLQGTGLTFRREGAAFLIVRVDADPQSGSAAGDGADGTVAALIVTAQKKEEAIQDVPIAISAFTEKSLEEQKIEGGFDLLKAIPNVTFSKNNFTSYNFSIRGVGTKAISATTDPGVAVSFNNIALIQNRLFEQEYFDVERVEVLRGPQGTLYGRNATAGVINVISAKPNMTEFKGWLKGEVGNYNAKRASAMVNIPLVEDKLAVRLAGAFTTRDGYDFNTVTHNPVNGRDLWSARLTIGFNPTERIRSNLIWERFNEDDNRSRTGKQLCHRDPGPDVIGNTTLTPTNPKADLFQHALFSQGCKPGSLYDAGAFGTPNGLALNFIFGMQLLSSNTTVGVDPVTGAGYTPLLSVDPYGGRKQSSDLRSIASIRDPKYRANADLVELNVDFDITDNLRLSSQSAYDKDRVYSFQDFNRFNTDPVFTDTSSLIAPHGGSDEIRPSDFRNLSPGGVFCDPQLGCSKTIAGFDISKASATQFSQEVRLQSDFDGPVNFSLGANYTKFDVLVDYYVMFNAITLLNLTGAFNRPFDGQIDWSVCGKGVLGFDSPAPIPSDSPEAGCPYIDPNPVESMNGEGHNYFRSKNPYKLKSAAAFGELYWQATDNLKVTAGLRYTDDKKTFIPVPSQVLLARGLLAGGTVSKGYPELPAIKQHWGEFTGRLGVDWQPELSFTDKTMLYAFYSRGYKGGGANPPSPGFASEDETYQQIADVGGSDIADQYKAFHLLPVLKLNAKEYGPTFKPEFVNAFEVGSKNTLLGGALTLNTTAFFYDYNDYQVSQIRDRTAVNENFDAKVWGLELESVFAPSRNLQIVANVGYLDTKIGDGATSIDIMNRTQGNPNYVIAKPWPQLPSNCVVPVHIAEMWYNNGVDRGQPYEQAPFDGAGIDRAYILCGGIKGIIGITDLFFHPPFIDPLTQAPYDPNTYPEINGGAGLKAHLGGNELPNSPHWTANLGAQYGIDVLDGWRATVRGDAYWQSQSWARVYNADPYDKLHGWYNVNLSVWLERPEDGLKIEFYAKNLLDKTPITDSFLNSDDTALTTNVFVLDPRLLGLSIKKEF